ncbi:hypothetical protein C8R45DRAFT_843693, partial [Mycena sanguinolenta]
PLWITALEAWRALEDATGFQTGGKALPALRRPEAMGWWVQRGRKAGIPTCLEGDGKREDFYEEVVRWWISLNPEWRREGMDDITAARFAEVGLLQNSDGNLDGLNTGLNGLTSVFACLCWWYHLAGKPEGAPAWRKLVEDVTWALTEKVRGIHRKQKAPESEEEPSSKHHHT